MRPMVRSADLPACMVRGMTATFLLALVFLVACVGSSNDECRPSCRNGYTCVAGTCVSACNPACGAGTVCVSGDCIPTTDGGGAEDSGRADGASLDDSAGTEDSGRTDGASLDGSQAFCGNGRMDPGEQCDDGNTTDGDGCAAVCVNERLSPMASRTDPSGQGSGGLPMGAIRPTRCAEQAFRTAAANTTHLRIRLRVWRVRSSVLNHSPISDAQIDADIAAASMFFATANMELAREGSIADIRQGVLESPQLFNITSTREFEELASRVSADDAIPIVYVNTISLPGEPNIAGVGCNRDTGSSLCARARGVFLRGPNSVTEGNGTTLAHELGHVFALEHTHACSQGLEVSSTDTRCDVRGDMFCDTPLDYGPSGAGDCMMCGGGVANPSCAQCMPDTPGSCVFHCPGGVTPDTSNVMSYYPSRCIRHFSGEQLSFIRCYLQNSESGVYCDNECPSDGATRCSAGTQQTCGNFDTDVCFEWGSPSTCSTGCSGDRCSACRSNWCADRRLGSGSYCDGASHIVCGMDGSCLIEATRETCARGCAMGSCVGCSANYCQDNGYPSGAYCDGSTRVTCGTSGTCRVETGRMACSAGCSGGICTSCSSNYCQNGGYAAGAYCDGRDRVTCGTSGMCRVETGRMTCAVGCSGGTCTACSPNYCQDNNYSSGAYCDGSARVTCGVTGACRVETGRMMCPAGCSSGTCTTCASNYCQNGGYSSGAYCDGGDRVTCSMSGACRIETSRTTCSSGCSGGSCATCASNYCQDGGHSSGSYCDGSDRVTCGTSGACRIETSRTTCSSGCSGGVCTTCSSNYCQSGGYSSGVYCDGGDRVTCGTSGACRVETGRTTCSSGCSGGSCTSPLPDLAITSFSPPSVASRGLYMTVPVTVQRTGGALTSGSYVLVRIYLSTDATITTSDYRASLEYSSAQFPNASLNSAGSVTQSVECAPGDVSLGPIAAGTYYWGAIVDPTGFHAESSESNNVVVGGVVSVR